MNELTHWGIKGQKWGVRRYQNDDGSYTPAGRERYYQSKENYRTLKKSGASETDIAKAKRQMKSDKDLYKRAKRADKGRSLYEKGKTITTNEEKIASRKRAARAVTTVAGLTLAAAASNQGQQYLSKAVKVGKLKVPMWQAVATASAGAAVLARAGIIAPNVHNSRQNEKMRSYWHRGNDVKNLNKNAKNPAYSN